MGIATSNAQDMVAAVLDSLDIRSYFGVVATACEVAAGKPAPDIYLKVAAELGVQPEKCLVFEDVPAGFWLENGLVCASARSRTYFHFP